VSVALIRFPGSNCDRDCEFVLKNVVGATVDVVWHTQSELPPDVDAVLLPGGFSYGDYLRSGAMAAHSPIMAAVKAFAEAGGRTLGICNGFQMLCETGILPGALLPNRDGQFICEVVRLSATGGGRGLAAGYAPQEEIAIPIAHNDGNYFAEPQVVDTLFEEKKVAFTYVAKDADGHGAANGARRAIAGLIGGPEDNVLGLMPHPERRAESRLGGDDGLRLLKTFVSGAADADAATATGDAP
jgi:phosphoribosylformylglycinamidine synthase